MEMLKQFYEEEEGMETVEVVILLAVLVSIALLFRKAIINFVRDALAKIFKGAEPGVEIETD